MVNEKRLLDTFLEYIKIDSESKNEKAMGEKLVADLKALGLEVKTDKAGEGFGSNGFNVYAYLPGTLPGDPHDHVRPHGYGSSWKRRESVDQGRRDLYRRKDGFRRRR